MKSYIYLTMLLLCIGIVTAANYWVNDPNSCPDNYQSQTCTGSELVCGYSGGVTFCYDMSSVNPPSSNSSTNSNADDGSYNGGFLLDCYAYDGSSPHCDNSGAFWCDRNSTCYTTYHKDTICLADLWGSTKCGNCSTNCQECDGSEDDADGCEICNGTSCGTNGEYSGCDGASGNCICKTNYCDCDSSGAAAGNGCENHTGDSCTYQGLPGTWSCSTCSCNPDKSYFETGTFIQYFTNSTQYAMLWWQNLNSTANGLNYTNTVGESILFNNDSCIVLKDGTEVCDSTDLGSGTDTTWDYNGTTLRNNTEGKLDINASYWENLYVKLANLVSMVGNWSKDKQYYDNQTIINTKYLNLSGTNANQDINIAPYDFVAKNITADEYFFGTPTEAVGSGIIWASEIDSLGNLNLTHQAGTLNIHYPNMTVILVQSNGSTKFCNIANNTVAVTDEQHSVYYVDNSCAVQSTDIITYIGTDLSPGGIADIFNVMSHTGDIEVHKGVTVKNKETIKVRKNLFKTNHLDVVSGMGLNKEIFSNISQDEGEYIYLRDIVNSSKQNTTAGDNLEFVYHNAGDWAYADEIGLNLTHCDNGTYLIPCSNDLYRRYFIFTVGFSNGDDETELHQLAALDAETYANIGSCLNVVSNPISYTLPDQYTYNAVVTYAYCGRRDDIAWRDGLIDLRAVQTGSGSAGVDTSIFLTVYGTRALLADWNAGNYKITAKEFNGSNITSYNDNWGNSTNRYNLANLLNDTDTTIGNCSAKGSCKDIVYNNTNTTFDVVYASNFSGKLNCNNIYGADADFCNDATGAGGGSGTNYWKIWNTLWLYHNTTAFNLGNVTNLNATNATFERLNVDVDTLVVDPVTDRVGVNTLEPSVDFEVTGEAKVSSYFEIGTESALPTCDASARNKMICINGLTQDVSDKCYVCLKSAGGVGQWSSIKDFMTSIFKVSKVNNSGLWVALGDASTWYSLDGTTWTFKYDTGDNDCRAVGGNGSTILLGCYYRSTTTRQLKFYNSSDGGTTWGLDETLNFPYWLPFSILSSAWADSYWTTTGGYANAGDVYSRAKDGNYSASLDTTNTHAAIVKQCWGTNLCALMRNSSFYMKENGMAFWTITWGADGSKVYDGFGFNGSVGVVVGGSSPVMYTSTDGSTWTTITPPSSIINSYSRFMDAEYFDGAWYISTTGPGHVLKYKDGSWSSSLSTSHPTIYSLETYNSALYAGTAGAVSSGIIYRLSSSVETYNWIKIAEG